MWPYRHLLHLQVNLILTSDHGMAEVNSSKVIFLDDYVLPDTYTLVDDGVNAFIIPHEGEKQKVYQNLTKVPNINVFYKKDIPEFWHYRNNRRITPIFVTSNEGYRVIQNSSKPRPEHGDHGYNNSFSEMNPFFIAHGPAFKKGYCSAPFSIVHIYSLICYIMGVTPAPNDGNVAAVSHILHQSQTGYALLVVLIAIAVAVLLVMFGGIIKNLRQPTYQHFYRLEEDA